MRLKRTKSELKRQRDLLNRFQRYLPTLQLKKLQLQAEVQLVIEAQAQLQTELDHVRRERDPWVSLFSEHQPFQDWLRVQHVDIRMTNVAGVDVPVLGHVTITEQVPDRYERPVWIDDGLRNLRQELELRLKLETLRVQRERLEDELRTTSQRVNLFDKVKIPECRENIRIIRIALGEEEVAAVARAKLAKGRSGGDVG